MTDPRIQQLLDKQEIREVLARYCRGIDRLDAGLIASVYHSDAYDDHGTYKGPAAGFVEYVVPALRRYASTMHFLGNCLVEIEGDSAKSETYCVAYHCSKPADGPETEMVAGVRYVDRFERRESGPWLIAHRTVVFEWSRVDEVRNSWTPTEFTMGRRDREDYVYTA